jgi:hypothetical protein
MNPSGHSRDTSGSNNVRPAWMAICAYESGLFFAFTSVFQQGFPPEPEVMPAAKTTSNRRASTDNITSERA